MRRVVSVGAVIAVNLFLLPETAPAQIGSSNASIAGVARDASGAVLPGVTVEAASPALIEKVRSTTTDDQGQYRIIELRPGSYSVTFTLPGFSVFKRDGLELSPNFTATVNAELRVGALEETLTVTGQTPLIDVENVSSQKVISKATLDAVPTSKSILSMAALVPAAIIPPSAQDVGGSMGERTVRMSVHGSKPGDQRQMIDGMSYNSLFAQGTGRGFYANPISIQEMVIDVGRGGSAEYSLGGAMVNAIPRDGGNQFSGTFFVAATNHRLQGDNFTDDLRAQGLRSVNGIREMHDFSVAVGGPIFQDKLWFFTAHRSSGMKKRTANLFYDSNGADFFFTPDVGRPVEPLDTIRSHTLRLTWQATAKDKLNFFHDSQRNQTDSMGAGLDTGTTAREAVRTFCAQPALTQASWTRPHSNNLLFEGGGSLIYSGYYNKGNDLFLNNFDPCGDYRPDSVSINDTGLGFTYNGEGLRTKAKILLSNARFSTSFFMGDHSFKAGFFLFKSLYHKQYTDRTNLDIGLPVSYTFNNRVPTQITQFVDILNENYGVSPDLGLFIQDQWRVYEGVTLNLGLRYDYIRAAVPAMERPAGIVVGAASFDPVDCVPCWHDLSPRVGVAWDPFGDGKTAIKAGVNRYLQTTAANLAIQFAPANAVVSSTTRSWTGDNGNFIPDCDLRNPLANGECGPMQNQSFGQLQIRTRPDPDWIKGFGKRPYSWQASLSIDREVLPGLAVNAGWYRTWFGNFTVTDNQLVTPADYEPYSIVAPVDARLGDISGKTITGLYDLKNEKFGAVNNVVTLAEKFGAQSEVYNGADLNFTARLPKGAQVSGGWNIGNSVNISNAVLSSRSKACFVVDSPQQLYQCDVEPPYQQRFKFSGSVPIKWDIQAAVVYQNLPSINYTASLAVSTAQIAQSLGRPLSGGTRTATVQLLAPFSAFLDERINQLDLRFSKLLRFKRVKIQGNFDLYNFLNANTILGVVTTYGSRWLEPTQVLEARLIKFSAQIDF